MSRRLPSLLSPRALGWVFSLLVLAVLFPAVAHARATGVEGTSRQLEIFGKTVDYQLVLKKDPRLTYDGEAYAKEIHGENIYFAVLNQAFFEKEAHLLFQRFANSPTSAASSLPAKSLTSLETELVALRNASEPIPMADATRKAALRDLQVQLERLAWFELYEESLQTAVNNKEAERLFSEQFTRIRLETIERHEVAHLLDLKENLINSGAHFEKYSELNAFYAELAYSARPLDVMAQALAGLIDELNRGQVVDQSLTKVATVLEFIKKCPRFAKLFPKGPMAKCCLEILAQIQNPDFILVGQQLYHKNQQFKLALADSPSTPR